ncbi:hypothetical protein HPO96_13215 [Kribbella sandramycini]|uniref:Peptidase MA-like domain-containing protein n=1 Tax=Kribbella sandramycini TaxID=60450 RepID=A0A7Y4KYW0_9ACTN|nr:hypothetical protein [Kribbella sandramycini]MBB6568950.1 hypothetical protein [Kribbella sandramycini]NOL41205.1 hypothetical protein [Kribbella sandramycini]
MKYGRRVLAGVAALAVAATAGVVALRDRGEAAAGGDGAVAVQARRTPGVLTEAEQKVRKEQVDALLAARARAVLKGDLKSFLAAVDPKRAQLVARQKVLFANLRKFGLTKLSYFAADERTAPELTQQYGATAFTTRVMMRYQLAGLDAKPVQTDLGYTYVPRGDSWLLVDDSGIDGELSPNGHRQPWDYQEVAVVRSGKVVVVVDKRELALGKKLAKVSKGAVDGVRRHWAGGWDGAVMVIAMAETRVMSLLWVSGEGSGWTIAAKAVPIFDGEPVGAPKSPVVSTRIVVNPAVRKSLEKDLLVHEMTHAATQRLGRNGPMWLVEGLAEYIRCATIEDDPHWTVDPYRKRVRKTLPAMRALPTQAEFASTSDYAYGQSWWTVAYLVDQLGEKKVAALYQAIATAKPAETDTLLKRHTGKTQAQLLAAVRKFKG